MIPALVIGTIIFALLAYWVILCALDETKNRPKQQYTIRMRNMMTGSYFTETINCDNAVMANKLAIARAASRGVRAAVVTFSVDEKA